MWVGLANALYFSKTVHIDLKAKFPMDIPKHIKDMRESNVLLFCHWKTDKWKVEFKNAGYVSSDNFAL